MGWCSDHGLPHSHLLGWTGEDRAKLIAHLIESASRCQMCGTSPWEWEEDHNAYEAGQETCRGCYVRDTAAEDAPQYKGSRVTLIPRKVAAERQARGAHRPTRRG